MEAIEDEADEDMHDEQGRYYQVPVLLANDERYERR